MPKLTQPEPEAPSRLKLVLRVIGAAVICAAVVFGAVETRSFVSRDRRFAFRCSSAAPVCEGLEVKGAVHSNLSRIRAVFAEFDGKGIFDIPLAERRRHLLAVDWVREASVARIWPDRIAVTIEEREPVAFASLPIPGSDRHWLALIDDAGVLLSLPPKTRFQLPVLSGISEDQGESERRKRVDAMQHLIGDMGSQAKEISEINASDLGDMRVVTAVGGHAVELWLGDQHYRQRYMNFMRHYSELDQQDARTSVFDLRLDGRILVR